MDEDKMDKRVSDLGAGAYLLMHGFKYSTYDRRTKEFVFKIFKTQDEEFEKKQDDYLNSEFHRFDSCLVSLKKRIAKFHS